MERRISLRLLGRTRRQQGYLLVELLVSVVIVAAGVLFLVESMRVPLEVSRQLLETDQALAIADEVMDRLLLRGDLIASLVDGSREVNGITYEWLISEVRPVESAELSSPLSLKSITVSWESKKRHSIRFAFLWAYPEASLAAPASL